MVFKAKFVTKNSTTLCSDLDDNVGYGILFETYSKEIIRIFSGKLE